MLKKYFLITYGCQMNKSDSEKIASVLEDKGYKPASKENEADLIVVNMCSIRQSAVDRVYAKVNKYLKKKKIILAGCILKRDKKKLKDKVCEFWHPDKYFERSPKYQSKISASVPIMTGCNNFCSFCAVPYTRGREKSRKAEEIICQVKSLIKRGYREIVLLGQNVNSYQDKKTDFPDLLKKINGIEGDSRIKFLTSHPKDMSDELIKTIAGCQKIIKEIHLPLQSGDNQILKKMKRHYTAGQYKNLVKKIRQKIPEAKISTDIIVGFPGETKRQFENTVKMVKEISFDSAFIAKYSPRPGTAAAKLKDNVWVQEKKRRWRVLNDILNEKNNPEKNLIVILGPTASGKSELAVKLAKKFKGEVISVDSRQVYREMDIGTGKVTKKEMSGVPHYLLDVASPKRRFTVVQYRKLALKAIDRIFKKGKIPILCGGSGFYIRSVVDGISIPEVPPDWKLRKTMEKKSAKELYKILKKLDCRRAKTIEKKNPRRLIRAIEIATKIGRVPVLKRQPLPYPVLMLGIKKEKKELKKLIRKRFFKWLKQGFLKEVLKLRKFSLSWRKIEEFGIHYREAAHYLQNKITEKEMIESSLIELQNYAKCQMSWFKGDKRIRWVKNYKEAERSVRKFLEK